VDYLLRLGVSAESLRRICQEHGVAELSLFGSGVREDLRPKSDVDLLVLFQPGAKVDYFDLFRLQRELEGLFGRKVDLVPKGGLRPILREEVLASSHVIYAA